MFETIKGKRVLITGAGTLTHEIARQFGDNIEYAIYSRNEANSFNFEQKFPKAKVYIGDVKDCHRLNTVFADFKPNIVIHGAAVKRVDLAQKEIINTVKNNVIGSLNVAETALEHGVEICVGIGTDKESNPQTRYGYSKELASMMFCDFNREKSTKFGICRYGNVMASRSSVGVVWLDVAKKGQTIKVTNPDMTRFWFPVDEAVEVIEFAIDSMINNTRYFDVPHDKTALYGRIYSTQMAASKLSVLAEALCEKYGCKMEITSNRGGEKLHESLISEEETKNTVLVTIKRPPIERWYLPGIPIYQYIINPFLNINREEDRCCQKDCQCNIVTPFTSDIAPQLNKEQVLQLLEYADKITYKG